MRLGNIQGKASIREQVTDFSRQSDSFSQGLGTTQTIVNI
jgi:hypothetical protein